MGAVNESCEFTEERLGEQGAPEQEGDQACLNAVGAALEGESERLEEAGEAERRGEKGNDPRQLLLDERVINRADSWRINRRLVANSSPSS